MILYQTILLHLRTRSRSFFSRFLMSFYIHNCLSEKRTVLLFPFQSIFFLLFSYLTALPIQCWMEVVTEHILVLFNLKCDVDCMSLINIIFQVRKFLRQLRVYHKLALYSVKCFCQIIMIFHFLSINVVNYTNWFLYVKSWDIFHMMIV